MAVQIEAGSALAQAIQNAAQQKLMQNSWASEENDTTLSEYVTMMLVNGKDFDGVKAELGGELLGVGEEDPQVADFTRWLFNEAQALTAQAAAGAQHSNGAMDAQTTHTTDEPVTADEHMAEDVASGDSIPSGPRAMRNGSEGGRGRGRGGRMLGQMNRHMDRNDDPLRRIKGAASGQSPGRIDSHAGRTPKGPRGTSVANGMARAGGRGGMQAQVNNPMMGLSTPDQQMMFMQMMEMQANVMAQMMQQNGGQFPASGGGFNGRGRGGKSMFDRISKHGGRQNSDATPEGDNTSANGMDIDRPLEPERKAPFDTLCKFNRKCLNPDCPFAHQSPANTRPGINLDMSDTCAYGSACTNIKCLGKHPSPAQRQAFKDQAKSEVPCKFYPNCTAGPSCPFKHPDARPCRNGADCKVEGCPFAHSQIACRYNPCTRRDCPFKHAEGQKRGTFSDKVWTADGADGSGGMITAMEGQEANGPKTADRFAELQNQEGQEELILPGKEVQQNVGEVQ